MKIQAEAEAAKQKSIYRKERIDQLAKPKDKWKVGKTLLQMKDAFPHDRVLQRMVQDEFKENQIFRYPEEYDVYKLADEKPKKVLAKPEGKKKGLRMADYSVGERALEDFKKDDIVKYQSAKEKKFIDRKKAVALE